MIHGVEGGEHALAHGNPSSEGETEAEFDPNDMTLMGGLRDRMPVTFWTFLIGALALSGVFPLAGFWSKDEILSEAFSQATEGGLGTLPLLVFVTGALAAFLTALYMGRQLGLVFWGRPRHEAASGAHESPRVMTWPLVVLAGATLVLGGINLPLGEGGFLGGFLEELHGAFGPHHGEAGFDPLVAGLSTALAVGGLVLGWRLYRDLEQGAPDPLARLGPLWTLWRRKYYIDEIYRATVVRGTRALAQGLLAFDGRVVDGLVDATGRVTVAFSTLNRLFDTYVVDGAVNGVGWVTDQLGREMRLIQTGQVQNYLLVLILSVIMLAGLFLYT